LIISLIYVFVSLLWFSLENGPSSPRSDS